LLIELWIDKDLCILCLIYSRSKDLVTFNKGAETPKLLRYIAEIIEHENSRTEVFTKTYNHIKLLLNSPDPYTYTKRRLTEVGKRVATIVRKYLDEKNWDIHEALKISAAANIIDTSVIGYEPKNLEEAIWDKPAIDEYNYIEIPKNKKIFIVLDNSGEAEIDLILAETLMKKGYNIAIAVRKEAYEIDVTIDDIKDAILNQNIEIIATPRNISPVAYLKNGFAIVKGIANLETYTEIEQETIETLHLFRAKCEVLAKIFNVSKNSPLIITGKTIKQKYMNRSYK